MAVTDDDQARIVRLLLHDTRATVGAEHAEIVQANAVRLRELEDELDSYVQRVVDDVQQEIHDGFIDTTWPGCPRHPNHPLWYLAGQWWCEQDGVVVAGLGDLAGRQT